MASTYLYRDVSSSSNRKTWTWSGWIKRGALSGNQSLFTSRTDNSNYSTIRLEPDRFHIFDLVSGGFNYQVKTNRRLRDPNGWYHLVVAFDTTQATASNRVKLYVNGVQETDLAESSYPSQNYEGFINRNRTHYIGQGGNLGDKFDGSMSHINFVDGTALTPSSFGSTDSITGEWKINTSPSVTYGTEGYFILKDGNSLTDQSPNSNNYTASGTLSKTEDNPSNVFATMNPLSSLSTFSQGNNRILFSSGSGYQPSTSTLGMVSGKFYAEVKIQVEHGAYPGIGIAATNSLAASKRESDWLGEHSDTYGYYLDGVIYNNGSTVTSGQTTFTTGDIVSLALDLDSAQNTLKYYKNGSLVYTLNINTNSNGYMFASVTQANTSNAAAEWNFGNGVFGTGNISSAGTNASGNGIFEYDVPTGYTALSTKGLNL